MKQALFMDKPCKECPLSIKLALFMDNFPLVLVFSMKSAVFI